MQIINSFQRDGEGDGAVGGVEVKDVHGVCAELFEGDVNLLGQIFWCVCLRFRWVEFRCQREA